MSFCFSVKIITLTLGHILKGMAPKTTTDFLVNTNVLKYLLVQLASSAYYFPPILQDAEDTVL